MTLDDKWTFWPQRCHALELVEIVSFLDSSHDCVSRFWPIIYFGSICPEAAHCILGHPKCLLQGLSFIPPSQLSKHRQGEQDIKPQGSEQDQVFHLLVLYLNGFFRKGTRQINCRYCPLLDNNPTATAVLGAQFHSFHISSTLCGIEYKHLCN